MQLWLDDAQILHSLFAALYFHAIYHCCHTSNLNTGGHDVGSSCILLFFLPFPEEVMNQRRLVRSSGSVMLEVVEAFFFPPLKEEAYTSNLHVG